MLVEESLWLKEKFKLLNLNVNDKILNVGSGDSDFREKKQPHIHKNIISLFQKKGIKIINTDYLPGIGIDMSGDLMDKKFIQILQKKNCNVVLCSNVLEHLKDKNRFIESLKILTTKKGSILIVTVPYNFPYHPDPIDNLFRPDLNMLLGYFSEYKMLFGEIVVSKCNFFKRIRRSLIKVLLFYRVGWPKHIKNFFNNMKNYSACCIVLEREDS